MQNESIFAALGASMKNLYVDKQVLGAIHLNMPVMTNAGVRNRIEAGMFITYHDGLMSVWDEDFTHKILECRGTLINQFEIECQNLKTGENETIKL